MKVSLSLDDDIFVERGRVPHSTSSSSFHSKFKLKNICHSWPNGFIDSHKYTHTDTRKYARTDKEKEREREREREREKEKQGLGPQ